MNWSYISTDKDSALVDYATRFTIEDKCTWQANTLDYILSLYNKTTFRRCIDAGANYGFLTVGFSRYFKNVDAFEISSDVRKHLLENTKTFSNIKIHLGGLYSKNTQVNFHLSPSSGTSRITSNTNNTLENVITLDSLNYTDVDLLKIDVEGSENELIKGAENTIKSSLPIIFVEMHCNRDNISFEKRQYIFNFLYSLGYKLIDVRHHDFLFMV